MKKLLPLLVFAQVMAAQTVTTTLTGTIKDLAGNTVTSGRILFTSSLKSGQDSTIPGTARFVPSTVTCLINASGNPVASPGGTAPCVITKNTAMSPAGTSYVVNIQPYNVSPGAIFNFYAIADTVDISTISPTPSQLPTNYQGVQGPPGIPGCVTGGANTCITSPRVFYASQLGCASLNVNLNTGLKFDGTAAHDDGPCISSVLASATAQSGVIVVIDGAALVSGIRGPAAGNWGIVGLGGGLKADATIYGTGFYQKAGTNDDVIHNGPSGAGCVSGYSDPGWITPGAAPARGTNVLLRDFVINGNKGNGTNGNSNSGNFRGIGDFDTVYGSAYCWYMGVNIMDMENVDISGLTIYNTSAYNIRVSNVGHVNASKLNLANVGYTAGVGPTNGDGFHVSGPANDVHLSDIYCRTTDDCIALNAPEGWGGYIYNVTIDGLTLYQAQTGIRMYTGSVAPPAGDAVPMISNVAVSNMTGIANVVGVILGLNATRTLTRPATITGVTFTNSTFSAPWSVVSGDNLDDIRFDNVKAYGIVNGCFFTPATVAQTIGHLDFNNVRMGRTANGQKGCLIDTTTTGFNGAGSAVISNVHVNGFEVEDEGSYTAIPSIFTLNSPSLISLLTMAGVSRTGITAVTNDATKISAIRPDTVDVGPSSLARFTTGSNTTSTQQSSENSSSTSVWHSFINGSAATIPSIQCFAHSTSLAGTFYNLRCEAEQYEALNPASFLSWTSGDPKTTAPDVGFSRLSANNLLLGDGHTPGSKSGTLGLTGIQAIGLAGTGNRLVCAHADGTFYAGTTTTCP